MIRLTLKTRGIAVKGGRAAPTSVVMAAVKAALFQSAVLHEAVDEADAEGQNGIGEVGGESRGEGGVEKGGAIDGSIYIGREGGEDEKVGTRG